MTRTDVMASSRPQAAGAASKRKATSGVARRLVILPVIALLALALVGPSAAIAAEEPTSTYKGTPTTPKETKTSATTPTSGTSPAKESASPTATTETSPTTASEPAKATTLPFTGFDLRWSLALGIVLIGAGFSIVLMQRRQRGGSDS
jgi:hypothetical protein